MKAEVGTLQKDLFPSTEKIFGWIEGLCQFPHRRTGTEEGAAAADYVRKQFEQIGLENIAVEEVPSAVFEAKDYFLKVAGEEIPCFMINGTLHPEEYGSFDAGESCRDVELVYLGEGRPEDFNGVDVKGKIVLCDCPWFEADEDTYATTWCKDGAIVYDPDRETRKNLRKTDSYSPNAWPYNYILAQKKGAVGFVGILNDYFEDGVNWNEDYSEIALSQGCSAFCLPGLWIGTTAFKKLQALLDNGKANASMGLKTSYKKGVARNVSGILPGMTDDVLLIHSHLDAVFTGAVQDASGMSEVFALAKYFSQLPKESRKKTLMFAGFDGHYTDYAGHQAFVTSRLREGVKIKRDIVIEHIGKEVGLDPDNKPMVSDDPELRLIYVTDVGDTVKEVQRLIEKNEIKRTIILPVVPYQKKPDEVYEFQQDEVISDAYYSYVNGIPVISMLSPQMYLFHPMDTPDMVPKEALRPVGMTFAEVIHSLFKN